jgi:hypothetical protein
VLHVGLHPPPEQRRGISQITSSSSASDKADATWIVRRGLADNSCVSFESYNYPGDYLRH